MGRALELIRRLETNVGRALVGKPEVVRLAVIGLVARGHLLIEDVPGVGKTTLAAALARSIGAGFQRIQRSEERRVGKERRSGWAQGETTKGRVSTGTGGRGA